jgi:hypothetical protein
MSEHSTESDPSLFIGLVTHAGSARPQAQTDQGVALALQERLIYQGNTVKYSVCNENLLSPHMLDLVRAEVTASIAAELAAEGRWRIYLNSSSQGLRLKGELLLRSAYRRLRLSPPWQRDLSASEPGAKMLKRLANIELAHISLLEQAIQSGADWALILEDDAHIADLDATAAALGHFLNEQSGSSQPQYVNVSQSFTPKILGTDSLGVRVRNWSEGKQILSMDQPVTNTVCAVLYSKNFVGMLLNEFRNIPLSPVLPIDWKLNVAIMNLVAEGKIGPGDCWQVEPAPFIQGSMHPTAKSE